MKSGKYILTLLWLCVLGNAQSVQELFEQANNAYEAGGYQQAADSYQKAINEGMEHQALYYNYANALFRLNKLGSAILYYEKALKLAPQDEKTLANLRYAQAQTLDKHSPPVQNILTKFLWHIHSSYSINKALWGLLILITSFFGLASVLIFIPGNARILIISPMVIIALSAFILGPSVGLRIHRQETVRFGIVLSKVLPIYSGPGNSYEVLVKVHEGTKFEIEDVSGTWARVKLANGKGGFVTYSELGKI